MLHILEFLWRTILMSWSSAWAAPIWRLHITVIKPAQYMFYLYIYYISLLEITEIKAVQYLFFLYLWSIWIERLLQEMKDLRSQNWDLEYIEQHFLAKVAKKSTNQLISIKDVIIWRILREKKKQCGRKPSWKWPARSHFPVQIQIQIIEEAKVPNICLKPIGFDWRKFYWKVATTCINI